MTTGCDWCGGRRSNARYVPIVAMAAELWIAAVHIGVALAVCGQAGQLLEFGDLGVAGAARV